MKLWVILICAAAAALVALEILFVMKKPEPVSVAALQTVSGAPEAPVAAETSEQPDEERAVVQEGSTLELELLGTLVNGRFPTAFIKDLKVNSTRLCRIGSVIQGATVVGIGKGEVTLTAGGKRHVLALSGARTDGSSWPKGTLIEDIRPGVMVVNTGELWREKRLILQELRQMKVRTQYDGRKPSGLRVEGIIEGGIITGAGLRNNDVIKEINEQKVDSYQKALQVFLKARSTREIRLNLVREGEVRQLSYRLQ